MPLANIIDWGNQIKIESLAAREPEKFSFQISSFCNIRKHIKRKIFSKINIMNVAN